MSNSEPSAIVLQGIPCMRDYTVSLRVRAFTFSVAHEAQTGFLLREMLQVSRAGAIWHSPISARTRRRCCLPSPS